MTNVNTINYPTTVTNFSLFPPSAVQPCVHAYLSASVNNATGDGTNYTVAFNASTIDQTNSLNTSNGIYTIPITGVYGICGQVYLGPSNCQSMIGRILVNGSSQIVPIYINPQTGNSSGVVIYSFASIFSFTAGNTVALQLTGSGGTKTVTITGGDAGYTNLCLWLVC